MSGGAATVENGEKKLREEAKRLLTEKKVDVVVGYEAGTLPLTATPCFITTPEEAEAFLIQQERVRPAAKGIELHQLDVLVLPHPARNMEVAVHVFPLRHDVMVVEFLAGHRDTVFGDDIHAKVG